jgi:hypothetical protein
MVRKVSIICRECSRREVDKNKGRYKLNGDIFFLIIMTGLLTTLPFIVINQQICYNNGGKVIGTVDEFKSISDDVCIIISNGKEYTLRTSECIGKKTGAKIIDLSSCGRTSLKIG